MFTKQDAEKSEQLFPDTDFQVSCTALVTQLQASQFINVRDRQNLFLRYYSLGITIKEAATAAGMDESTVHRWQNDENSSFASRLTLAKGFAKTAMVNNILTAAQKDWKAAAWYLERKHPKEYAELKKVEATHTVMGQISVDDRRAVADRFLGLLQDESPDLQTAIN